MMYCLGRGETRSCRHSLGCSQVKRMEVLDSAGKLSENDQKRLANLRVTHRVLLKKKKAQEEAVR